MGSERTMTSEQPMRTKGGPLETGRPLKSSHETIQHFIRTLDMTGDMDISLVILQFDPGCEGLP